MGRVRKSKQRSASVPRARRTETALKIELLHELYNVVTDTALAFGITREEHLEALERAKRKTARKRPSVALLKNDMGVSNLLAYWRKDPKYVGADGAPKVLPIKGRGASLEHLARQFTPDLALRRVVDMLTAQAEVIRVRGGKVALVGNPANIIGDHTASAMAWTIKGMRHLASSHVYNFRLPLKERSQGRFQRLVYENLPKKQVQGFSQEVRPRLQEVSNLVEKDLQARDDPDSKGEKVECGIGLYVFGHDLKIG